MAVTIRQHIDMGNIARITNLAAPINDNDAVRKVDLNSAVEGISWKDAVKVATQGNINLASPGATIDGVTIVNGDRILVKAQTLSKDNGIYIFNTASSLMVRAIDCDSSDKLEQAIVAVEEGSSGNVTYRQTQVNFILGTDDILWTTFGTSAGPSTENSSGIIEIATQAEVNAGADDTRAITPLKLATSPFTVKRYNAVFGDNSTTLFAFTHNIGSRHVFAKVFKNSAPYNEVLAQIEFDDDNTVSVEFAVAPSTNEYIVSIIG